MFKHYRSTISGIILIALGVWFINIGKNETGMGFIVTGVALLNTADSNTVKKLLNKKQDGQNTNTGAES